MTALLHAPVALGRGVVVLPGQVAPPGFETAPRVRVGEHTIRAGHATINTLHVAWATRTPVVVELSLDPAELLEEEATDQPPWALGLRFLFPRERLRFLVWANNADYRFMGTDYPQGRWWHAVKAQRIPGITLAGADEPGDIRLPDGRLAWLDGGPRDGSPIDALVVHREDLEADVISPVGPPVDEALLATLTPDQQGAVRAGHGAVRVPAPAGSGKTRVLSARLATVLGARNCPPGSVLALVYNTRAAEELRERVGVSAVTIKTVHAHAYGLLRRYMPGLRVLDEREVRNSLAKLVDVPRKANADPIGPWIDAFDMVRANLHDPEEAAKQYGADLPNFAAHFTTYRERLRASQVVDFAEMVPWAIDLLLTNPQIRAAEQAKASQILVDEFQDLTPAYLFYIRLLASPQLAVFGVGDDDQVIYGHAGANPAFLIDFNEYFPGATSHTLATNHRCPADVVAKTNTLLTHNFTRISKEIQHAPQASSNPVTVHEVSAEDGADKAVELISNLVEHGVPISEIAVLARVNVALLPVQAALTTIGISLASPITPGLLERSAVRACLTYLRLGIDPEMAGSDLAEILHRPLRAIPGHVKQSLTGRRWTIEELQGIPIKLTQFQVRAWKEFLTDLRELRRNASHQPTAELLRRIIVDIDLGSAAKELEESRNNPGASTHTDDLSALRLVAEYCPDPHEFEAFLQRVINPPPTTGPVITLSSIHKVKGLEWPYVLVVGANEGVMPHRMAQQPDEIEEERRVFHVAITRAKTQLDIIAHRHAPSRFIKEMNGIAPQPSLKSKTGAIERNLGTRTSKSVLPTKRAAVGMTVSVSGGLTGEIVEVREDAIYVSTASRAILRVPIGSVANVDGQRVRLTSH